MHVINLTVRVLTSIAGHYKMFEETGSGFYELIFIIVVIYLSRISFC